MEIEQQLKWEKIREKTGFPHILLLSYNSNKFSENSIKGIYDLQGFYRYELFNILKKYILTKNAEYEKDGIITARFNCETRLKEIIDYNFFNKAPDVNTCICAINPFGGPIKDRTKFTGMKNELDFSSIFVDPESEIFLDFMNANTAFPLSGLTSKEADRVVENKINMEKRFNKHIMFCVPEKEDDLTDFVEILTGYPIIRNDFDEVDFSMKFARAV